MKTEKVGKMKRMIRSGGRLSVYLLVLLLVSGFALQHHAFSREVAVDEVTVKPEGYTSVYQLVELIGRDAGQQFDGFFSAGPVRVEPFPVLGESAARRISVLGATLADQMVAEINRGSDSGVKTSPANPQLLRGVIQEVDGYLRVHISGRNSQGQWRSYLANAEMSEAVYRAMHTYVSYER